MDWKEILTEKSFRYHRFSSLVILLITTMFAMLQVVIPFLISFFPTDYKNYVQIISLIIVDSILISHWYYYRAIFPKGKKNKQNIVIAIITENQKQKDRISEDFVDNLKKQLKEYQLDNIYDIIVIHNALSIQIRRIIEDAFLKRNSLKSNQIELERFDMMSKRMNARFFVYGNLISRNAPNNRYVLNIEGLIRHNHTHELNRKELSQEFNKIWQKEISFLEEEEINGFKSTSNQIFFAATYMLGLATFVDYNYLKGIEINIKLLKYVKENEKYKDFESKVRKLLSSSYYLFSRVLYFNGDIEQSINFRRKYLELTPDDYNSYLNEAIYHVNTRNDPEMALDFIEKAQKIAKGNGVWKYSKLYLLIKLNRHVDALKVLDMIISTSFEYEFDAINQVISYNLNCLKTDPCHVQSLFIIGVLAYKKLNNLPVGLEKLEEFIKMTDQNKNWEILNERASKYLVEINKTIGIEEN